MKLQLTNVQRFSLNDGPGIRTTLFAYGCSIRCPWCANPECVYGDRANKYDVDDLLELCLRDEAFYCNDGGVTASGGEMLLQAKGFAELFKGLKSRGIETCIETSLYAPMENLKIIIPVTDYYYVDFKVLNGKKSGEFLKADYAQFTDNLSRLFGEVSNEKICIRIPLVKGITYTENNLQEIERMLDIYSPGRCEIFSVHNLGKAKYNKLGLNYNEFDVLDDYELEAIHRRLGGSTSIDIKRI